MNATSLGFIYIYISTDDCENDNGDHDDDDDSMLTVLMTSMVMVLMIISMQMLTHIGNYQYHHQAAIGLLSCTHVSTHYPIMVNALVPL